MKAVAFDLDDTLLHDDLTISSYTVDVFRRMAASGFIMIASSGRARLSMKPFVDILGCVSVSISCNGGEIWDEPTGQLIHRELLSADLAREIAVFGEAHNCYAQVYEGPDFFYNRYDDYAKRYALSSKLHGVYAGPLSAFIREPRNKILMMADARKIASMLKEAKAQFGGRASVTCSKPIYLEFNPLNATKGKALEIVSSLQNITLRDVVAFGDSLNDLSMLQRAGTGVMVSNGWDEVRPFCDDVCLSNNEDGPARYLEQHFLRKEVRYDSRG